MPSKKKKIKRMITNPERNLQLKAWNPMAMDLEVKFSCHQQVEDPEQNISHKPTCFHWDFLSPFSSCLNMVVTNPSSSLQMAASHSQETSLRTVIPMVMVARCFPLGAAPFCWDENLLCSPLFLSL